MTVKIVVWQGLKKQQPFFALEMKNLHLLLQIVSYNCLR